jgi:UDP-N-acetylmuramate: L-alanyl-gamma-D-glutamyl-meso-diaminopimelate ligase
MVEGDDLLKLKDKINKVFFFRICGTGMGASACLLKEAGIEVEGADQSFSPPMSTYLDSTGIPCFSLDKVNKEFLQKYDLIIAPISRFA